MRLKKGKGKNFEDRTATIIDKGYADTDGKKDREDRDRYRQAKVAGPNDNWVPLKYRNGYHRADYAVGKVKGQK